MSLRGKEGEAAEARGSRRGEGMPAALGRVLSVRTNGQHANVVAASEQRRRSDKQRLPRGKSSRRYL